MRHLGQVRLTRPNGDAGLLEANFRRADSRVRRLRRSTNALLVASVALTIACGVQPGAAEARQSCPDSASRNLRSGDVYGLVFKIRAERASCGVAYRLIASKRCSQSTRCRVAQRVWRCAVTTSPFHRSHRCRSGSHRVWWETDHGE